MKKYAMEHKKEIISGGILFLQIVVIIVYNLTMLRYKADYDSSSGMVQLVEIWRQKTLLIQDWAYQTTSGWDIPLIFAVLFYGITKNVFVSMGIANSIFAVAYAFLVYDILKKNDVAKSNIFAILIVLFTPYATGQLGYFSMLFIGTASYSVKVLITLLLIDILLGVEKGAGLKKMAVRIIFLVLFSLLSGLSSGLYMLVCGVLPVIIYFVWKALQQNTLKWLFSKPVFVTVLSAAAFVVGIILGKLFGLENSSSSMTLLPGNRMAENALNCFVAVWELFGAVRESTSTPLQVISKEGIVTLLGVVVTALFIFAILYYAVRVLQRKEKRTVIEAVLCVVLVNMCVLLLTDTTYSADTFECRYHIVAMIPAMLLFGMFFQEISQKMNRLSCNAVLLVVVCACVLISGANYAGLYMDSENALINDLSKITDLAKEEDVDLIYVMAFDGKSMEDGRILRACDFDVNVATLVSTNQGSAWGESTRYYENGQHQGKIMVMCNDENMKDMPAYLAGKMKKVGEVLSYKLYVCEENIFDCSINLPKRDGETAVDFPYSPSYTIFGEITDTGELRVGKNEGIVMYGSRVEPADGTYNIRLKFKTDDAQDISDGQSMGTFGIYKEGDGVLGQVEIIAGQECVLNAVDIKEDMGVLHYSVVARPNSGLMIESIVVEKRKEK